MLYKYIYFKCYYIILFKISINIPKIYFIIIIELCYLLIDVLYLDQRNLKYFDNRLI